MWLPGCSCAGSPLLRIRLDAPSPEKTPFVATGCFQIYSARMSDWCCAQFGQMLVSLSPATQGSVRVNPDWLKGCCRRMTPALPSHHHLFSGCLRTIPSTTDPAPFLSRGVVLGMVISALRAAQRLFVCVDRCSASQLITEEGIIIYSWTLNSKVQQKLAYKYGFAKRG